MIDIIRYHDWLTLAIVFIPWSIGISVVIGLIVEAYWNWLFDEMGKERRYETIKVSKW